MLPLSFSIRAACLGFLALTLPHPIHPASSSAVTISNHCSRTAYAWPIEPLQALPDSSAITIPAQATQTISITPDKGTSLKTRDVPKYQVPPAGIMQVEYTLASGPSRENASSMFYDLSFLDCSKTSNASDPLFCPWLEGGVDVIPVGGEGDGKGDGQCPNVTCQLPGDCVEKGTPGAATGTYVWERTGVGEPSLSCSGVDLGLLVVLCSKGEGRASLSGLEPAVPASSEEQQEPAGSEDQPQATSNEEQPQPTSSDDQPEPTGSEEQPEADLGGNEDDEVA